jgi:hypothetical protein
VAESVVCRLVQEQCAGMQPGASMLPVLLLQESHCSVVVQLMW